ncbi:MAG: rRNA maturation RNase YbeY [Paracoccaceae bacterium]|nr:rRNA maturation RNase YbeY [Paracoccaceae bacterium]
MTAEVIIEADPWRGLEIGGLAARAVDAALADRGLDPADWEVAVLACDDARIAELNAGFRGKNAPTNVLSWPSEERGAANAGDKPETPEGARELGDIALAFETCFDEAAAAGKPLEDHLTHLIVHGTLHLLGYDHSRDADGDLMESVEIAILAKLGLPNPYAEERRDWPDT